MSVMDLPGYRGFAVVAREGRSRKRLLFVPSPDQIDKARRRLVGTLDNNRCHGVFVAQGDISSLPAELAENVHFAHELGGNRREIRITLQGALRELLNDGTMIWHDETRTLGLGPGVSRRALRRRHADRYAGGRRD